MGATISALDTLSVLVNTNKQLNMIFFFARVFHFIASDCAFSPAGPAPPPSPFIKKTLDSSRTPVGRPLPGLTHTDHETTYALII